MIIKLALRGGDLTQTKHIFMTMLSSTHTTRQYTGCIITTERPRIVMLSQTVVLSHELALRCGIRTHKGETAHSFGDCLTHRCQTEHKTRILLWQFSCYPRVDQTPISPPPQHGPRIFKKCVFTPKIKTVMWHVQRYTGPIWYLSVLLTLVGLSVLR